MRLSTVVQCGEAEGGRLFRKVMKRGMEKSMLGLRCIGPAERVGQSGQWAHLTLIFPIFT